MALLLALATTLRNAMLDAIDDALNAGAGAALMRVYDGTRPSTGGTATTLLAELTCSDPACGAAASGVLTFAAITQDSSANATGTATWGRFVDSTGTFVGDFNVGTSGADFNLNTVSITAGQIVSCTNFATITDANS